MNWKHLLITLSLLITALLFSIINPCIATDKNAHSALINPDSLKSHVETLSIQYAQRNVENLAVLNESAEYIKKAWQNMGCDVKDQWYLAGGDSMRNLIVHLGNPNCKKYIIGAHYDACHTTPGADDNASGVAGLLELTRALKKIEKDLLIQVELVAYSTEEPPYFRTQSMGSYIHANSVNPEKVQGMICLEMIGYFSDETKSQEFPVPLMTLFYPSTGDYIVTVGKWGRGKLARELKKSMLKVKGLNAKSISAPSWVPGIDFSDHLNYWNRGVNAVMVTNTAFYRNKNYHTLGDTPEKLNYDKMAKVVTGVFDFLHHSLGVPYQ